MDLKDTFDITYKNSQPNSENLNNSLKSQDSKAKVKK